MEWCELNVSQRTVISSVLFDYPKVRSIPAFWKEVTSQVTYAEILFLK